MICTPFTGQKPVKGVFLCVIVMNLRENVSCRVKCSAGCIWMRKEDRVAKGSNCIWHGIKHDKSHIQTISFFTTHALQKLL